MPTRAIIQKVAPSGEIAPPRLVVKTSWDEWAARLKMLAGWVFWGIVGWLIGKGMG